MCFKLIIQALYNSSLFRKSSSRSPNRLTHLRNYKHWSLSFSGSHWIYSFVCAMMCWFNIPMINMPINRRKSVSLTNNVICHLSHHACRPITWLEEHKVLWFIRDVRLCYYMMTTFLICCFLSWGSTKVNRILQICRSVYMEMRSYIICGHMYIVYLLMSVTG